MPGESIEARLASTVDRRGTERPLTKPQMLYCVLIYTLCLVLITTAMNISHIKVCLGSLTCWNGYSVFILLMDKHLMPLLLFPCKGNECVKPYFVGVAMNFTASVMKTKER